MVLWEVKLVVADLYQWSGHGEPEWMRSNLFLLQYIERLDLTHFNCLMGLVFIELVLYSFNESCALLHFYLSPVWEDILIVVCYHCYFVNNKKKYVFENVKLYIYNKSFYWLCAPESLLLLVILMVIDALSGIKVAFMSPSLTCNSPSSSCQMKNTSFYSCHSVAQAFISPMEEKKNVYNHSSMDRLWGEGTNTWEWDFYQNAYFIAMFCKTCSMSVYKEILR